MTSEYSHDVFISFSFKDQETAEAIVNELTSKYGISCWICTRDIDGGRRYKRLIPDAIRASKAVVFLQSENSSASKEIPKEIGIAMDDDITIIPFKIDKSILHGDLEYDLYGIEYIDATVPTMEQRVYELAKAIGKAIGKPVLTDGAHAACLPATEKLVSTPNVIPKTVFCGREDVLSEIHARYENGERVLFLYGIGGIGKTQIAKQYAKQYRQNYHTVVYATYNGSIRNLVIAESPFAVLPEMVRYTLSDGSIEADKDFFARKMEKIKKLSNAETLIILDNFDVDNDEDLSCLLDGNYNLLITTRNDFSRYYPTITINPLQSVDELKNVFMKNYQGDEVEWDDPLFEELIELVNRHTYTIELLAQHMENSNQTIQEMICALKEQGITSLNEEVRNSDMKTNVAYENLLKMFRMFSLDEQERKILMYLSLMPAEGINVRDFRRWAELESSKLIHKLENSSWITRNTNGIALHPVISAVIKHEIPAAYDNCREFISNFVSSIDETKSWNFKKVDKDRYARVCKALLSVFTDINADTEPLYYSAETLFSFAVEPEYAVKLARDLFAYYEAFDKGLTYELGRAAYKVGWAYSYNTQLSDFVNQGLKWLSKAEEILSQIDLTTTRHKGSFSQTLVNLARLYLVRYDKTHDKGDYESAKQYAERNVDFSSREYKVQDPQYPKVAGAYWQLADVLRVGGEYDNALMNIDKSLDILIAVNGENNGDTLHAMNRKAAILYSMGKANEAMPLARISVEGYIDFFGENNPKVVGMYKLFGDCNAALGEFETAKAAYQKALEIAKLLYARDASQISQLQECISKIE